MELQTATAKGGYESIYNGFHKVSELAYFSMAANPELINLLKEAVTADEEQKKAIRLAMASLLESDFLNINKLQFENIRFYLPDNQSFLRLNEPELSDADRSSTLYSVAYVNTHHQPADGFEIGKHADLFRFVYPLFDDNENYIGCVELSVSPRSFMVELERSLQMHLHFIVNQEMLPANREQYVDSLENDHFLKLLRMRNLPDEETDLFDQLLDEGIRAKIDLKMLSDEDFTICLYKNENTTVATFLAVTKDKVKETAAYLVLYKKDLKLMVLGADYWGRIGTLSLLLFIAFVLLSFQTNRKNELTHMLGEKNSELEKLNDHLSHLVQERTDALREESAFIREVLDALPIYIFWKDLDKNYLGCNALFANIAGMKSEAEVIGKDDFTFSWRGQASRYRSVDEQVIATGEARKKCFCRHY
jgi:PAS domain-containing protein